MQVVPLVQYLAYASAQAGQCAILYIEGLRAAKKIGKSQRRRLHCDSSRSDRVNHSSRSDRDSSHSDRDSSRSDRDSSRSDSSRSDRVNHSSPDLCQ